MGRDSIPSLQRIAVHSGEELDTLEEGPGDLTTTEIVLAATAGVLAVAVVWR